MLFLSLKYREKKGGRTIKTIVDNKKVLGVLLILLSIGMGSYLKSSMTSNNTKDAVTELSKSDESSLPKQQANGIDIQKTEMHSKMDQNKVIDQDEKREDNLIVAEREEDTRKVLREKKALKPHHLYVKNPKEMEKVLLKQAQKRDMEKRLRMLREKHSEEREL